MKEGRRHFTRCEVKALGENQGSLAFLCLLGAGVTGVAPCLDYVVLGIKSRAILPYE